MEVLRHQVRAGPGHAELPGKFVEYHPGPQFLQVVPTGR